MKNRKQVAPEGREELGAAELWETVVKVILFEKVHFQSQVNKRKLTMLVT